MVIEDIHWADEATLDLPRYLSRRLRGAQVLLIASYRDDEVAASGPLRVAPGDLAEVRWTRRVELAPLSAQAVGELAAGSGLAPDELCRLTGGNPFFVSEVLCAGMDKVPLFARDAVLARAARLSRVARELLDVAALVGTRVEVRVLKLVAACTPADTGQPWPALLRRALDIALAGGYHSQAACARHWGSRPTSAPRARPRSCGGASRASSRRRWPPPARWPSADPGRPRSASAWPGAGEAARPRGKPRPRPGAGSRAVGHWRHGRCARAQR
ncbi:MAG TPA: hypothetical protein VH478_11775 [Trebonia sp.]|nr:hypothetical protein [Trebonia sp.]